jgi:hypothetical protein
LTPQQPLKSASSSNKPPPSSLQTNAALRATQDLLLTVRSEIISAIQAIPSAARSRIGKTKSSADGSHSSSLRAGRFGSQPGAAMGGTEFEAVLHDDAVAVRDLWEQFVELVAASIAPPVRTVLGGLLQEQLIISLRIVEEKDVSSDLIPPAHRLQNRKPAASFTDNVSILRSRLQTIWEDHRKPKPEVGVHSGRWERGIRAGLALSIGASSLV